MAGVPVNFPGASETELRSMLKQVVNAMPYGGAPTTIGSGDFNLSINGSVSLENVKRRLIVDLALVNPTVWKPYLTSTVSNLSISQNMTI